MNPEKDKLLLDKNIIDRGYIYNHSNNNSEKKNIFEENTRYGTIIPNKQFLSLASQDNLNNKKIGNNLKDVFLKGSSKLNHVKNMKKDDRLVSKELLQ